jgi:hypothetical protein
MTAADSIDYPASGCLLAKLVERGRRAARWFSPLACQGQQLQPLCIAETPRPSRSLSDADLEDKVVELAAPVIGAERAQILLKQIWSLDRANDLQGLALAN